jgi:hypothetical protein
MDANPIQSSKQQIEHLSAVARQFPRDAKKALNEYIAGMVASFAAKDPGVRSVEIDFEGNGRGDECAFVYVETTSGMDHGKAADAHGVYIEKAIASLGLDASEFARVHQVGGQKKTARQRRAL